MTTSKETKINRHTSFSKTSKSLIIKEEIDEKVFTSKILKKDITGYKFSKRSKSNNQLWWALIGLITAVITWQVSNTNYIAIYGSIILLVISFFLYFDHVLQKDKLLLTIFFNGNSIDFHADEEDFETTDDFLKKIN
tara:strand:- start:1088 stop:1498 length:411 start_codon:yes stop_codon:yes gene_type:complete